jgi:alcohol dehydrogenase
MDVIVNFTGGDTLLPSIKALRVGGRVLICGASAGHEATVDLRYVWRREVDILGCNSWAREDLEALIELVQRGRIVPPIHSVYPLEDAREAFRVLLDREVVGKAIVVP